MRRSFHNMATISHLFLLKYPTSRIMRTPGRLQLPVLAGIRARISGVVRKLLASGRNLAESRRESAGHSLVKLWQRKMASNARVLSRQTMWQVTIGWGILALLDILFYSDGNGEVMKGLFVVRNRKGRSLNSRGTHFDE